MKSVVENITGVIERLLRGAQRVLGAGCDSRNRGWEPLV